MRVAFGCDHAGWPLRDRILAELRARGVDVVDCGPASPVPGDDYPDVAAAVGRAVVAGAADPGGLACGSGVGASIAAGKMTRGRGSPVHRPFSGPPGGEEDAMNVIGPGASALWPGRAGE